MRTHFALALTLVVALASLPSIALGGAPVVEGASVLMQPIDASLPSGLPFAGGDACPPSCLCPACPGNCGVAPGPSSTAPQTVATCPDGPALKPPLLPPSTEPGRIYRPPRLS